MTVSQPQYAPRFDALPDLDGLVINDPVEDVQFHLYTDGPISPTPVSTETGEWCFPIDSAARLETATVTVPITANVNVRSADGTLIDSSSNQVNCAVDTIGSYTLELASTPIKLYLHAHSRVTIDSSDHDTTINFPDADAMLVGARTLHEQPARTLTTTTDPVDIMTVVSEFGAALKTTSPERSFPTLRGHPPLVTVGDEIEIPGGRHRPSTGITIELPPETAYIFPAAPLAYYLGASVEPGDAPLLRTTDGYVYELDGTDGFGPSVHRVLTQVFTMDCLTRVDGYYPVDLAERNQAEADPRIELEYASLYEAPLTERVEQYLSVPYEAVEPLIPRWRLTADMSSDAERVQVLPHLTAELAEIRCDAVPRGNRDESISASTADSDELEAVSEFIRGAGESAHFRSEPSASSRMLETHGTGGTSSISGMTRAGGMDEEWSTESAPGESLSVSQEEIFRVPDAKSATQTYIGDGFPIGANKATKASFERLLTLRSEAPSRITVTVVCNDQEMLNETAVGDHYGDRDLFEFDVDIRTDLSVEELQDAFQTPTDFVHYIGHVDQRGLQARDGFLDAHDLSTVETTAFFLNGCRSFKQGSALVAAGAVGGIVTLENVHNDLATDIGHHIARLLNQGWPLDGAANLVEEAGLVGRHYNVVGDSSVELVNPTSGVPKYDVLSERTDDRFDLTVHTYPSRSISLGSLYTPYVGGNQKRYLSSGEIDTFTVTGDALQAYLASEVSPVLFAPERDSTLLTLRWSDELEPETL